MEVNVGRVRSGDVCGYGDGLVHVLVGVVRLNSRETANRASDLCKGTYRYFGYIDTLKYHDIS